MFFRKRKRQDEDRKQEVPQRSLPPIRLPEIAHTFAQEKLECCLISLGYPEAIPRISNDLVEDYRILYQALPFRIYVYDLDNPLGEFEFTSMCDSARPSSQILEVASIRIDCYSLAYYLYALQPVADYTRDPDASSGLSYARFALDLEWDRLMAFSRKQDVAYSIPWIRELYGQTAQELVKVLVSKQMTRELAEAMILFNDETLHGLLERLSARLEDQAESRMFGELIEMWFRETSSRGGKASDRAGPLRTNPLIAVMFAMTSPLFCAFTLRAFEQLCQDRFAQLGITSENVTQCNDLFSYIVDRNPDAARDVAELAFLAAVNLRDREALAYASYDLGAVLASSDDESDVQDAVTHLESARELFLGLDTIPDLAIGGLDISLRRAVARLAGMSRKDPWRSITTDQRNRLLEYNAAAEAGDVDGAIRILDEIAGAVADDDPVRIDLNSLAGQLLTSQDRVSEAYKRLYRCENLTRDDHLQSESGFFEVFKCNLLYHVGNFRQAAEFAQEALDRIGHVCELDCFKAIVINLAASLSTGMR